VVDVATKNVALGIHRKHIDVITADRKYLDGGKDQCGSVFYFQFRTVWQ
jgi:hypothetical protein